MLFYSPYKGEKSNLHYIIEVVFLNYFICYNLFSEVMPMSKRLKFTLLFLLSLISVFFAEVISGSMKFPLFDLWGYLVVIPLYGLHTIILLFIISKFNKNKKILFSTLYFGGVLFGLYEAYITKVLWTGLSEDSFILLELAIVDYIVLVFFWHPIFSFIIPSLVFEKIMTNSNYLYQGLPSYIKKVVENKYGIVLFFTLIGIISAFNGIAFDILLLSLLGMSIPIMIILYFLRRKGIHNNYSFDEILPTDRGIVYCIIYLVIIYIFMIFFDSYKVITLQNQFVIWINYIIFGFIFYKKIFYNSKEASTDSSHVHISFNLITLYLLGIIVGGLISVLLLWILNIRDIFVVVTWIIWIFIGLVLMILNLFENHKHI